MCFITIECVLLLQNVFSYYACHAQQQQAQLANLGAYESVEVQRRREQQVAVRV
jgi:hypothetical protein